MRGVRWLPVALALGALLAAVRAAPREDGGPDDGRAADEQQRRDAVRRPRGHAKLHAGDGDGAGALPISGGAGSLLLLPLLQQLLLPRFLGGAKNAAATFHDGGVRPGIKAHAASVTILPLLLPITPLVGVGVPVGLLVRVFLRAF
jgi:hypothetical protein